MNGRRVLRFMPYVIGVVSSLQAIPLALGLVGPNGAYGIRVPETLKNEDVWYSVNTAGGISMVAFSVMSMIATFLLHKHWGSESNLQLLAPIILQAFLILISIGVVLPGA